MAYSARLILAALIAGGIALPVSVWSQPPTAPGPGRGWQAPSFAEFDLNGDGILTEAEFNEARAKRIAERSQQGYPMRGLANAPTFKDFDRNGDGRVDPAEFTATQAEHRGGPWRQQ